MEVWEEEEEKEEEEATQAQRWAKHQKIHEGGGGPTPLTTANGEIRQ